MAETAVEIEADVVGEAVRVAEGIAGAAAVDVTVVEVVAVATVAAAEVRAAEDTRIFQPRIRTDKKQRPRRESWPFLYCARDRKVSESRAIV